LPDPFAKRAVGGGDVIADGIGPLSGGNGGTDGLPGIAKAGATIGQCFHMVSQHRIKRVGAQKGAEGFRCGGKAGRHPYALGCEAAHHLAQRRILAADQGDILAGKVFKPDEGGGFGGHGLSFRFCDAA
jgi:hypothetical protein